MGELPFALFTTASYSASTSPNRGQRQAVLTAPEAVWEDIWHRHSDEQHPYFFHNPQNYLVTGNKALSSSGAEEKIHRVCKTQKNSTVAKCTSKLCES